MKKLIAISIVLVLLSSAAFAQEEKPLKVGFSASLYTDLLYFTKDNTKNKDGEKDDLSKNREGSLNFLNSSYTKMPGSGLSLTFTHTGESHEASVQLSTDGIMGRLGVLSDTKWFHFLMGGVGDWYFKGNAGMFDGYVGNTGYGGKVDTFGNFDDFLKGGALKLDGFGVYSVGYNEDTEEFSASMQGSNNMDLWGKDIIALGATFGSFRLALGSHLDFNGWNDGSASASSINAAFMLSGEGVANLLNLDLFYAIAGADPRTTHRGSEGKWRNVFGVYGGLKLMDDKLGVGVGYTGKVDVEEKGKGTGDNPSTTSHPFYSGINLHVNFAANDKMGITFNNNLSFANVKYTDAENKTNASLYGGALAKNDPDKNEKEGMFVWHAAIKVGYSLSDALTVNLQLANVLMSQSYTDGDSKKGTRPGDEFFTAITADYTIGKVSFGAGLSMDAERHGRDKYNGERNYEGNTGSRGTFTLGIPVYFKVAF